MHVQLPHHPIVVNVILCVSTVFLHVRLFIRRHKEQLKGGTLPTEVGLNSGSRM